jgi:CBS domain-containing protein
MTPQVACCLKEATLQSVAQLMVQYDCGEIPVVVSQEDPRPVGVVTDRDIVCRAIAEGRDPTSVRADEVMTAPAITVTLDTPFDDCLALMRDRKIRRLPVLDAQGRIAGIIAQADIARHRGPRETGKMVERVSTQN